MAIDVIGGYGIAIIMESHRRGQKKASALADALRAIDGARTRGLDLGKVARYQLRHYRICDVG